jgi:hypothetical protein
VKPVEEGLDQEGLRDEVEDSCENEERRGGQPPRTSEPGSEAERDRRRGSDQQALDAHGHPLVAQPAGRALRGKAIAPPPPERNRPERKRRQPEGDDDGERNEDSGADPAAADSSQRVGKRPRLPDEQDHDDDLHRQRSEQERAAHVAVLVRPRKLRGSEVVPRIEGRNAEARHARPPEKEARDDPEGREDDEARALR